MVLRGNGLSFRLFVCRQGSADQAGLCVAVSFHLWLREILREVSPLQRTSYPVDSGDQETPSQPGALTVFLLGLRLTAINI